jgi:hypothetical protein
MPRLAVADQAILRSYVDSRRVNAVSWAAEALYLRLLCVSDGYGRYRADAHHVACHAAAERLREGPHQTTVAEIEGLLGELQAAGLAELYEVDGEAYLQLAGYYDGGDRHRSIYPPPPGGEGVPGQLARSRKAPEEEARATVEAVAQGIRAGQARRGEAATLHPSVEEDWTVVALPGPTVAPAGDSVEQPGEQPSPQVGGQEGTDRGGKAPSPHREHHREPQQQPHAHAGTREAEGDEASRGSEAAAAWEASPGGEPEPDAFEDPVALVRQAVEERRAAKGEAPQPEPQPAQPDPRATAREHVHRLHQAGLVPANFKAEATDLLEGPAWYGGGDHEAVRDALASAIERAERGKTPAALFRTILRNDSAHTGQAGSRKPKRNDPRLRRWEGLDDVADPEEKAVRSMKGHLGEARRLAAEGDEAGAAAHRAKAGEWQRALEAHRAKHNRLDEGRAEA